MITITLTLEEAEELSTYAGLGASEYGDPEGPALRSACNKLDAAVAAEEARVATDPNANYGAWLGQAKVTFPPTVVVL